MVKESLRIGRGPPEPFDSHVTENYVTFYLNLSANEVSLGGMGHAWKATFVATSQ
jgi:hypothetical protein